MVYFSWQLVILFRFLLLILLLQFILEFFNGEKLHKNVYYYLWSTSIPILSLLPTDFNTHYFDLVECEPEIGPLHYYLYALEFFVCLFFVFLLHRTLVRRENIDSLLQRTLVALGGLAFMLFVFFPDVIGEYFHNYEVLLFSPLGALLFFGLFTYMIVRYRTFDIKIFASQALVLVLWILIGSLLLVVKSETSRIITVLTLALSIAFGIALVRSVRREVDARRKLAEANEGQERFIHFLSHEVKGYLTVARNGFAAIGQGDLGPVSEEVAAVSRSALERLNDGVSTVENILRSANLKSGNMTFAFAPFDLAGALRTQVEVVRPLAEKKGLALTVEIPEGEHICVGDKQNVTEHVLRNLLENAIHYTERGSVRASLARVAERFVLRVVDTGIGISQEDRAKLFTQGGRGVDSLKYNVHSTGHGLFIAKSIVEAHGGTVRAMSEGKGKGTTFEVGLPVRRR